MTVANIKQVVQSPSPGGIVELFTLDLRAITGGNSDIYRFTPNVVSGSTVSFAGNSYVGAPIKSDGWSWSGTGPLPQPTITVGNVGGFISGLIISFSDMIGTKVIRIKTLDRFLDGGTDAPATPSEAQMLSYDIYTIERKTKHDPELVEFQLSSILDQEGKKIPRHQAFQSCRHRYRAYMAATSSFDYTNATCPYVGSSYFDRYGNVTAAANDVCGKRLKDCKARFGATATLPYGGFPSMSKTRVS